ncbi:hypothetical protein EXN66_Car002812 [Channa argus]|uniref:Uncharacterized protein n=1 Tax=Channa argus TaxID=215402 RepID=A0A6G1PA14_CHAAH|nr:hypothetical protein EXN66_Car002812 [Channa argus]
MALGKSSLHKPCGQQPNAAVRSSRPTTFSINNNHNNGITVKYVYTSAKSEFQLL